MSKIKVAAIQFCPVGMDINANLQHAEKLIRQAASKNAKLIVLPELFVTGYYLDRMKADAKEAYDRTQEAFGKLTEELDIGIVAGVPIPDNGHIMNSAVYIENGKLCGRYDKINLFAIDNFSEADYFRNGTNIVVVDTSWGKLGMMVCADVRFPEYFVKMAMQGAEIITISAAFPYPRDSQWVMLTRAEAAISQSFVIACNRSGTDGPRAFCGRSQITGPDGAMIACSENDSEETIIAEIDLDFVAEERRHIPAITSRDPSL